jgi:hypothetical protein
MPRIYLSHCFSTNESRTVLYKQLRNGINKNRRIIVSWINIRCNWCGRFVSRDRIQHKCIGDLVLCDNCFKQYHEIYNSIYRRQYWEKYRR